MSNAGMVGIPYSHKNIRRIKDRLTINVYDVGKDATRTVLAYVDDKENDRILVPRYYGMQLGFEPDFVSYGYDIGKTAMNPVKLRDYQEPFVNAVESLIRKPYDGDTLCTDIRVEAYTGFGKTISTIELCRRLQITMLVIVDQEFLRDQWIEAATSTKLFNLPRSEIGIVQGKKEEWEDKTIVVAMLQTLYNRDYGKDFYEYFGMVTFDESHTVGADQYSNVLNQFPAAIRMGVSATPERTDELEDMLLAGIGPVQVVAENTRKESKAYYVDYDRNCYSWYANTSSKTGRYITEISEDGERNLLLGKVIKALYDKGHYVLAVSDRTLHVFAMQSLLIAMGVPEEDVGVVATTRMEYRLVKNPKPKRKPEGYVKGTDYTPVSVQLLQKRADKQQVAKNKDDSRIVLATYGKFEKGVDVPHLSAGVDMTPRSKATQLHGRILREMKGKLVPVWVTIRDIKSYRSLNQFANRITQYVKSNAEVYRWELNEKPQKVDATALAAETRTLANRLRSEKIMTKRDGNYTVKMKSIENVLKKRLGSRTERKTRKVKTR